MPGEIGRYEAAERRACERSDQCGDRQQSHCRDKLASWRTADKDEPRDRRHHGTAHALQEARNDEGEEAIRHRAKDGARDEDEDRRAEDALRAEPVRHPAAQGNEDRQRHHIGGQRELQRDRPDTHVARDCRQRCRNNG